MTRTDPLENLASYVMVHGGIDRHDRLIDIEWLRDVLRAARGVCELDLTVGQLDVAIDKLRKEFSRDEYKHTPSAYLSRHEVEGDDGAG